MPCRHPELAPLHCISIQPSGSHQPTAVLTYSSYAKKIDTSATRRMDTYGNSLMELLGESFNYTYTYMYMWHIPSREVKGTVPSNVDSGAQFPAVVKAGVNRLLYSSFRPCSGRTLNFLGTLSGENNLSYLRLCRMTGNAFNFTLLFFCCERLDFL